VAGAFVVAGPAILSACSSTSSGDALANARSAGSMKIGIAGEQPYGFTPPGGQVTGEAPEVAKAVLQAIGIPKVQAEQVEFGSLIPALNARQFDMVCAGMNITPARCQQAAFSIPDYSALTALLVPAGNPQQLRTFSDVAAKNLPIAVLGAAVEESYAKGAGVKPGNIQTFPDQNGLLQAVTAKRVACAALTQPSLSWLVKQNPGAGAEVTPGFTPVVNGKPVPSAGGFVFRKSDNNLREAFNAQLTKLHDSGQWVRIASPFGFSQANVPPKDLTTDQLCAAA
jgi:polar amino acid transport system substrate-binding protein